MCKLINLAKLVIGLCVVAIAETEERLLVNTEYGGLWGKLMTSQEGREFVAFLGIPYASPPVGRLRFMPPEPPQAWEGLRNATTHGSFCVQIIVQGEEDCLYLNVFTHETKNSLPVMVFIHGGGFYIGSSSLDLYGPEYLMDQDIVLVTIQYRLGVFGFLSTEDSAIPGNMGLKDQVQALHWVKKNIKEFGGDPEKVTVFGNSAGSVSVHLHMLSKASKGLFARAISQSGTAFSAFSMIGKGSSRKITNQLAVSLNCSIISSEKIAQCLRSKSSAEVQKEYSRLQDSRYEKVLFRPVIEEAGENSFLTVGDLHSSTDKPWLVGINKNEGLFKVKQSTLNETIHLIKTEFSEFGPAILFFEDTCTKPKEVAESIKKFYFENTTKTRDVIVALEQMISDSWFIWPTIRAIQQHDNTLYCYLFDHMGEHSMTQVKGGIQGFGVSHEDELHYLFSQKQYFPINMKQEDVNISKLLVSLWTNFAAGGNPTPSPISDDPQNKETELVTWEETSKPNPTFLHIETNKLSFIDSIFQDRMNFWKLLPVQDKNIF